MQICCEKYAAKNWDFFANVFTEALGSVYTIAMVPFKDWSCEQKLNYMHEKLNGPNITGMESKDNQRRLVAAKMNYPIAASCGVSN